MSGFVWHDLMARDIAAAKEFYAELLGWQYAPFGPEETGYEVLQAGEHGWGGVMAVPDPGMPAMWLAYAEVGDLDSAAERVAANGGTLQVEPTPIPGVGRFAIAIDPQGAAIGLFETSDDSGPGAPSPVPPGGVEWGELVSSDLLAALLFYEAVLGWTSRAVEMGPSEAYTLFSDGARDVAGAMALPQEALERGARSHWITYWSVEDVEDTMATAARLGAETVYGPIPVPGVGRLAGFHDPQGAAFAVLQPKG